MKNFVKRILCGTVAAFALCGLLAGCDGAQTAAASVAAPASEAAAPAQAATPAQAADGDLLYNDVVLTPGAEAAPVLEALGEPDEYSENISCMFESGMDKTYTYGDVTVYTYPTETVERILLVDATGSGAQTSRGVRVGDALDAALLAYADDLAPDGTDRYTCVFGEVLFSLTATDGTVSDLAVELAESPAQ